MNGNIGEIKTYFVTIPAHKFLGVSNRESNGYFDFWQKMDAVPDCDCDTISGLLESIPHKLDDLGGGAANSGAGQIMGYRNDPKGRVGGWGVPLAECYGVRLPLDYADAIPEQMQLDLVAEGEYIVFEHGPFDYEKDSAAVEDAIEAAMRDFDYAGAGCALDLTEGRYTYLYHDPERFFKYVRPIVRG